MKEEPMKENNYGLWELLGPVKWVKYSFYHFEKEDDYSLPTKVLSDIVESWYNFEGKRIKEVSYVDKKYMDYTLTYTYLDGEIKEYLDGELFNWSRRFKQTKNKAYWVIYEYLQEDIKKVEVLIEKSSNRRDTITYDKEDATLYTHTRETFSPNGQCLSRKIFNRGKVLQFEEIFTYNSQGLLMKSIAYDYGKEKEAKTTHFMKWDDHQNWTLAEATLKGESINYIKREIEYYPT